MLTALLSSEFLSGLLLKVLKYFFKKYRNQAIQSLKGENNAGVHIVRRKEGNQAAIVFVHGFGGDARETWGQFPSLITADAALKGWDVISVGYNTGLMPDIRGLWAGKPDIQKLADFMRTIINKDFSAKYQRLVLVAHSMGGLVIQRSLLDLDENERNKLIHGVILFGTPSQGLKKAHFGRIINRQIRDLGHEGAFIKQLRQDWSETIGDRPAFRFLAVAGDLDEFVPADSSLTPFTEKYREITAGNHVDIVKPDSSDHLSYQILHNFLTEQQYQARSNGAEVALELGEFQQVLNTLGPVKDKLDYRGQVTYALALTGIDKEEEAVDYLSKQTGNSNPEIMGTLAGRYKRRWLVNSTRSDAEQALELYEDGYAIASKPETLRPEQAYYHAINLAFLHLLYKEDFEAARSFAHIAIKYSEHKDSVDNIWKWATLGEAHLYLQDGDKAFDYYQLALEAGPQPRQKDAMYLHWHPLTKHLAMKETEEKLELLFHSF